MCGIVLAGGSLASAEVEVFNHLLYADVFRGVHATGVFAKRPEGIVMAKEAVPSYIFQHRKEYDEVLTGATKVNTYPTFLVGHNRHATRGASGDSKNAHPFQHGNITLVHNGTLYDQDLLPDSKNFVVDSDNVCYSIDKIGAAETIQKLNGAFTLVWHDAKDDTVHIIRNDERPFHLAKAGMDWFGASEEDMLMWILMRHKSIKNRKIEHFECEIGTEYVFDVSGPTKRFVLKEEIKHNLPTFTWASRYSNGWQSGYQSTANRNTGNDYRSQSQEERRNKIKAEQNAIALMEGLSVRIDHRIAMCPTKFERYNNSTKGKMSGYFMDNNGMDYVEVDVFGVEEALYEDSQRDFRISVVGTIQGFSQIKGVVRCFLYPTVSLATPETEKNAINNKTLAQLDADLTELNDDIPFDEEVDNIRVDENDSFRTIGGKEITYKFWHQHQHGFCMGCDKQIAWKDAPKAAFAHQGFWHPECLKRVEEEERQLREQEQQSSNTFLCNDCGKEKDMKFLDSTASAVKEQDICSSCGSEMRRKGSLNKYDTNVSTISHYENCDFIAVNGNKARRLFNSNEFKNMIRESGSDKIEFKDLNKARITQKSYGTYSYFYKKESEKQEEAASNSGNFPVAKYLPKANGVQMHITKARWNEIGVCEECHSNVPWKDVNECVLTESNRIVCKNCKGKK